MSRQVPETIADPVALKRAIVTLKAKLDGVEHARHEGIAVVGAGCRFPRAGGPEAFWRVLRDGVDVIREVPKERWNVEDFYDPDPDAPGKSYTRWGGFLDDVAGFDAQFFGISPREAAGIDPQQRLLLELAWEAIEDAGIPAAGLARSRTGVFVGMCGSDYLVHRLKAEGTPGIDNFFGTGLGHSMASGRISYTFGFEGPSLVVDTACSSSLVALHLACQSLRARECDTALAGGVNLLLSPESTIAIAKHRALSPDGRCKTFDASANGFVRSEGGAVLVLRRLSDAIANGDRVLAVVRGSAINQDGRSSGLTAPNLVAQMDVIRAALAAAKTSASRISMVEAHGTGTSLGDPIEVEALKEVFGGARDDASSCALGSVKTNLGHLEGAAGIAGVLKVVLALRHRSIPAHLHLQRLNPRISLEGSPFFVPTAFAAWPAGSHPRLAAVSSFGFSGTNAHVILEEAASADADPAVHAKRSIGVSLLPFSARSPEALRAQAAALRQQLVAQPDSSLTDICYTAALRRDHHAHRAAVVGATREALVDRLGAFADGQSGPRCVSGAVRAEASGRVAFVFSGQGSQWAGMGVRLFERSPAFRDVVLRCDAILRESAAWSIIDALRSVDAAARLRRTEIAQPLLFAIQAGLVETWRSFGVVPDAVTGHSAGEVAAAYAAGALTLEQALHVSLARGDAMKEAAGRGRMASVETSADDLAPRIRAYGDRLTIAGENAPRITVLSGEADALDAALAELERDGIAARQLDVDYAFHSAQMAPARTRLEASLAGLRPSAARARIYSTVSGDVIEGDALDAAYWSRNVREPVQLARAVSALARDGHTVFVEIGAHPSLREPLAHCLAAGDSSDADALQGALIAHSMRRGRDDEEELLAELGRLHASGFRVDWREIQRHDGGAPARLTDLPAYPWQRQRCWIDGDGSASHLSPGTPVASIATARTREHALLGDAFSAALDTGVRYWQNEISADSPAFLGDHSIRGEVVFPAAAYLEMAIAAARSFGTGSYTPAEVDFVDLLSFDGKAAVTVQTSVEAEGADRYRFRVMSHAASGEWRLHARGFLKRAGDEASTPIDLPGAIVARCPVERPAGELYAAMRAAGIDYGAAFRGIARAHCGDGEAIARLAPNLAGAGYRVHPALLDACFQVIGCALGGADGATYVPVSLDGLRVLRAVDGAAWGYARVTPHAVDEGARERGAAREVRGDLWILDEAGDVLVEAKGLRVLRLDEPKDDLDALYFGVDWIEQSSVEKGVEDEGADRLAPAPVAPGGRWLVLLGARADLAMSMRAALEARGETCVFAVAGPAYARAHDGTYAIDPARPDDYARLVDDAFESGAPRGVVHLWAESRGDDLSSSGVRGALELGCRSALHLIQALAGARFRDAPRLWIVTRGAQSVRGGRVAPAHATLWGLAHTAIHEHPELRCALVDLDPADHDGRHLAAELAADGEDDRIAYRDGVRYVARLARASVPRAAETIARVPPGDLRFRLEMDAPGVLENLAWRPIDRRDPGPGEVEIRVDAVGLNFLDVLSALGVLPPPVSRAANGAPTHRSSREHGSRVLLGGECAGTIVGVGKDVYGLVPGQRVVALAGPSFASHLVANAALAVPYPESMTPDEAATIPLAFLTAHVALLEAGRLARGERVLIHAAAGGVGFAAVRIAKRAGAEIFATAGSAEKRDHLRALGVDHVFDSRSLSFVEGVLERTRGEGVDVVLNSLAGDFIPRSFELLRDYGRFVEIGKRDYFENRRLGLKPFLKNLSFTLVDLTTMLFHDPEGARRRLERILADVARGELAPLPYERFGASRVAEAFRYMAQAKHTGKIVVSMADPEVRITTTEAARAIDASSTYLVTGGLGGLGLETAKWMAGRGARHVVLMGRGEPSSSAAQTIADLARSGVAVTVARGDVARGEDVARVLDQIRREMPSLRGVIHAAGVLEDGAIAKQSWSRFEAVFAPKVLGALHLHEQTRDTPLDFFILYSSAAALFGSPGQASYSAANAFLDQFAHHRRQLGLPASSIDWGPWTDVGMAAREGGAARRAGYGIDGLSPELALRALDRVIGGDRAQTGVLSLDLRQWREAFIGAGSLPFFSELLARDAREGAGGHDDARRAKTGTSRQELLAVPAGPKRRARIASLLTRDIAHILQLDPSQVEPGKAFRDFGIDSLLAIELRNRLESTFGTTLPTSVLWSCPNVSALVPEIARRFDGAATAATAATPPPVVASPPPEPSSPTTEIAAPARNVASEAKVAPTARVTQEPIAIVGVACRFPGGANDPGAFWDLLRDGREAIGPVPRDRWDVERMLRDNPDLPSIQWGGFLEHVDRFDAAAFGISPREAESMDPQQRLVLEIVWEALEDAGIPLERVAGTATGVFIGACSSDYGRMTPSRPSDLDVYSGMGASINMLAGRVSYLFDLRGPSVVMDTACSSSLVAVHYACESLRRGEADTAIAAGVNLIFIPEGMVGAARMGLLSPDGHCRTFDARADGMVRGEGCGAVVLKRWSDAVADHDRILALIPGSGVNQDGRSNGQTAPNGDAQVSLLRSVLGASGVRPSEVSYIEAHGTGTPVGDPIEIDALREVLGQRDEHDERDESRCTVGSVKTNIGHSEGAAGIAGLIKVILSLTHETIPKIVNFRRLNPRIAIDGSTLAIASESSPWPRNGARRVAGVSSFGWSGTNAHVLVTDAPRGAGAASHDPVHEHAHSDSSPRMLPISARSSAALVTLAGRYASMLESPDGPPLDDAIRTASTRRSHHAYRAAFVGATRESLATAVRDFERTASAGGASLDRCTPGALPVVFVFSGQGSQWVGMGRRLFESNPSFRSALERCDAAIRALSDFSVEDLLTAADPRAWERVDVLQPLVFAMQVSIAAAWRSMGVVPDAVVGHSLGEIAAAHVAGALDLEDAARVICLRSRLVRETSGHGAMALVELSAEDALACIREFDDRLAIAAENGPEAVLLSGDPKALDTVLERLRARDVFCRLVGVDYASHCPQMDPLLGELRRVLEGIRPRAAAIPMHSTVTGERVVGTDLTPAYWANNLRERVRFYPTVERLFHESRCAFVEVSPHPILVASIERGLRRIDPGALILASGRRDEDEQKTILESLAHLYARGFDPAFDAMHLGPRAPITLPSYPWQRERHWIATATKTPRRADASAGRHPLLETSFRSSRGDETLYFESDLAAREPAYLADHRVRGDAVFPAAAYLEMVLGAAPHLARDPAAGPALVAPDIHVRATFREMLVLPDDGHRRVQLALSPGERGEWSFQIASAAIAEDDARSWTEHASGTVRVGPRSAPAPRGSVDATGGFALLEAARARSTDELTSDAFYTHFADSGIGYGPLFRAVERVWRGAREAVASLRLPEPLARAAADYTIHPVLLDACLQLLGCIVAGEGTYVPVGVDSLRWAGAASDKLWAHAVLAAEPATRSDGSIALGDVRLFSENGACVAEIGGVSVRRIDAARDEMDDWLYDVAWEPAALAAPSIADAPRAAGERWLVIGDAGGVGDELDSLLARRGGDVVRVASGDRFAKDSAARYRVDPRAPGDLTRLFEDVCGPSAPRLSGVIYLLGLDAKAPIGDGTLEPQQRAACGGLLHTAQALVQRGLRDLPRLWVVTQGAQAVDNRPVAVPQATLWGFGRALAYEHPELRPSFIDVGALDTDGAWAALADEIVAASDENQIVLRGDSRYVGRLARRSLIQGARAATGVDPSLASAAEDRPFRVELATPGILDGLTLRETTRTKPGPGEVEIAVHAAALNFIDVMQAMGVYPGQGADVLLGAECAGVVTEVGPDAFGVAVGDDVIAMAGGSFGTHATTSASFVIAKPASLSFEEAATIPVAFLTAFYALVDLGRLDRGERVLIHSASGGVGLAALQIAQGIGAEIFATAGTEEKRAFLRSLGVDHVFDSRSGDFSERILERTGGTGVDVVLNSLTGDGMARSFDVLRPYGRFLEIGKRDIYQNTRIGLSPFKKKLSYHAVDLLGMCVERPDEVRAILREIGQRVEGGSFRPLRHDVVPIAAVADAFRTMAQAKHVGKIVLSMSERRSTPIAPARSEAASIRPDRSYLITGGLGGLGSRVAAWMAARGARTLVLLGRSAPSANAQAQIDALAEAGVSVHVARGDVASPADVRRAIAIADGSGAPLAGVVHAAGVLDDALVLRQDWARFARVMSPKVDGAWNLHVATEGRALDFFVLFSSGASLLGAPGQSNYSAANAFLDALAHHRAQRGQRAVSIDWGPWTDVGLAAAEENRGARIAASGMRGIAPEAGLKMFERILASSVTQVGVLPIDWRQWRQTFGQVSQIPLFAHFANGEEAARKKGDAPLLLALRKADAVQRKALMAGFIATALSQVLRIPSSRIDETTALPELGLDSLMALELRNRIEAGLDVRLPASTMWSYKTVSALAGHLLDRAGLGADVPAAGAPGAGATTTVTPRALVSEEATAREVAELPEDEIALALAAELSSLAQEEAR